MKFISHPMLTVIGCLFLVIGSLNAQTSNPTAEVLLEQVSKHYAQYESMDMKLEYNLLRNPEAPIIIEQYDGRFIKDANSSYLKIKDTEFISLKNKQLKVNHRQKRMLYLNTEVLPAQSPEMITSWLRAFSSKKVYDEGDKWRCELEAPKLTQLPYGKVIFYISKDEYHLERQLMTLVSPMTIRDERGELTKELKYLEIKLEPLDSNQEDLKKYLSHDSYIISEKETIKATAEYSNYQIIDKRI